MGLVINVSYADEMLDIPFNVPIEVERGIAIFEKANQIAKESGMDIACDCELLFNDETIYELNLNFPYERFDLFSIIQDDLATDTSSEKEAFLDFIATQLNIKKKKMPKKKQEKVKSAKEPKKRKKREIKFPQIKLRMILVPLIAIVIFAGGFLVYANYEGVEQKKPSYSELMKDNKFTEAAKLFPKRINDIEQVIFEGIIEDRILTYETLETFCEDFETEKGQLDIALLESEFEKAVMYYEKMKEDMISDKPRLTLIGYSYLKLNKIEKAVEVQEKSNSVELEKYITKYRQYNLQIEELERELKELEKNAVKNKDALEQKTNELYDIKEELENL